MPDLSFARSSIRSLNGALNRCSAESYIRQISSGVGDETCEIIAFRIARNGNRRERLQWVESSPNQRSFYLDKRLTSNNEHIIESLVLPSIIASFSADVVF
jgi:hypothetical protein